MALRRRWVIVSASGLAVILTISLLTGCSGLRLFNTLAWQDAGVARVVRNLAYGPDTRQTLDLYVPAGRSLGTVVFIYGGSWSSGRKEEYAFAAKAFAGHGYTTLVADYRLVPQHRYPVFVEDTAKAVAWAYRHTGDYGGDRRRLFVVGHSAGAYNVMMVALAPEFLHAEGLSRSVLSGAAGLSGPYDFLPLDVDATRQAFQGVKNLAATQPINRVGPGTPPILLATGEADDVVSPRNTEALVAALQKAGRPVEVHRYPGIGHAGTLLALSRPLRGSAPVLDDLIRFFERSTPKRAGE